MKVETVKIVADTKQGYMIVNKEDMPKGAVVYTGKKAKKVK